MARSVSTFQYVVVGLLLGAHPATADTPEPLDIQEYVSIVLRTHPAAGQAAALEESAAAERRASRLLDDPVVEWSRASAQLEEGHGGTENSLTLSQTIPWPGTYAAGRRVGESLGDELRSASDALRWGLAAEAREAFQNLLAARARVVIALAAEEDSRALRDLTARRAELGETRESDRIKAEIEWLREERALAAVERQAETAEALLRLLTREPLPEPLVLEGELPPAPPAVPGAADLIERLLEQSPTLRAARARAAAEEVRLDLARSSRLPDLGLALFRNEELDKEAKGFALGLRLPLWNAQRGEIGRARAAADLAGSEAQRAELETRAALLAALREFTIAASQVALFDQEILPAATQALSLVRLSFEEGETSLLDLLDAQRTQRATRREALEARLDLALAAIAIQRVVGPDFDPWR